MKVSLTRIGTSTMGKGKPRHNPEKPQNKAASDSSCMYWDILSDGRCVCELNLMWDKYCDGNPHKCKKAELKYYASLPENGHDQT